jgi:hypothetical protein
VYRVNRRPLPSGDLVPAVPPRDAFQHFVDMLAPGYRVTHGRAHKRVWRVGGIQVEWKDKIVTGRLGSQPAGKGVVSEWSNERKDWETHTTEPKERELLPFGFDGESRLLTVLQHGRAATTIAAVFQTILRDTERKSSEPTTVWSVEPVLDRGNFLTWLNAAAVVNSVSFTAKLPNPEPKDDFKELWERISRTGATQHSETMRSTREVGLEKVEQDIDFKQAMAMGQQGYATLRGEGRRGDGARTIYRQTKAVASEHVDRLPPDWEETRAMLKDYLKGRLRRFLDEESA